MAMDTAFSPGIFNGTVGATTTVVMASGAPAASLATITMPGYANAVMVTNSASLVAFVVVTTTAGYVVTTADTPIPPSSRAIFAAPEGTSVIYVGARSSATLAAGSNVYFTPGIGGGSQS